MTDFSRPAFVKPAPHARVRYPHGALLSEDGEFVALNSYFARLIADGDLVEVEPPKESKAKDAQGSDPK